MRNTTDVVNAPPTLFVNAAQTITCAGPARARRGGEMRDADVRAGVGVAVQGDRITAVDTDDALRQRFPEASEIDCDRGLLAPGFVDSHTHAIFGKARYEEQELRATGVPYLEIARRGGGIHSSVRDLRARSDAELFALAVPRLARLAAGGVTTVEIKSGYGLSYADELRTLRVIARLADALPQRIVATCLAAHEIPFERRELADGRTSWIREIIDTLYPAVADEQLATFADVFCEPGVFTLAETRDDWRARNDHYHRSIEELVRFAVRLAAATRPSNPQAPQVTKDFVEWGAGPRASQYLILGAKALALLEGKVAAETSDVRAVAAPVLQHRVITNYRATGAGKRSRDIVADLLTQVQEKNY